jgi:uncharacterized membrane protein (DUF106 family)
MKQKWILLAVMVSFGIAWAWDKVPIIPNTTHSILDPVFGALLNWNLTMGMIIVVFILSLIMSLIQKYTTDQKALKELKADQKKLQDEMQKCKDNPQKLMELNKKQFDFMGQTFKITMNSLVYTAVPFILFFRWFGDYFHDMNFKFFGLLSWFWFYVVFSIIFSIILKKPLKLN